MKRFEYLTVETSGLMSQSVLKMKGELGWEMCGFSNSVTEYGFIYYFKKEMRDE